MPNSSINLYMPRCGEDGVIIAIRQDGKRVEFRGRPYSKWDENEQSPMYDLHSCLKKINISNLHSEAIEVVTPWHPEWETVETMFNAALTPTLPDKT
jgi:hypothetical protein